jgi:adenosylcobalamin-dependent ribonucleoside-triphosphate reductase
MKQQYRDFYGGMGHAVAERTILRKKQDGKWETWQDVADRVALGNAMLCRNKSEVGGEYETLKRHLLNATTLMSGRHLQHGDSEQPSRNMEVFTNCATSSNSFMLFYLLMNGSGVGRCYDDDMMLVNYDHAPIVRCVLDEHHPDYDFSAHESVRDAKHKYGNGKDILWHKVADSREGWAKALEVWENAAFQKVHADHILILDFSDVRCKGSPIKGMQDRPASGPVPLMNAFQKAASIKGAGLPRWMQAMYVDHYFAECVLVGGARRAARMSAKTWRDKSVLEFITIKRPIEYIGKPADEIMGMREQSGGVKPQSFLWSSNNSILVDEEFWKLLSLKKSDPKYKGDLAKHARKVFRLATSAAYADGTGEPGFINQDKLVCNTAGLQKMIRENHYLGSKKYQLEEETEVYTTRLLRRASQKPFWMIVNPCSEIAIALWGAFCTIADLVPFHGESLDDIEDCARALVRALIRVNLMDSVYSKEVQRTNRIGIGLTGIHEFAWKFFGLNFHDLINEEKSKPFWMFLSRIKRAIRAEAVEYATELGVEVPHTDTTIKPSGTVSKLFGLTEGWHLPAMLWYMRWVQFSVNDPLVETYKAKGYPVQELKQYKNTVIVGFPTTPAICDLGMNQIVTAGEATPEQQYQWLMLGEKYWIRGVDEAGEPLPDTGNQISYTLKYTPKKVTYKEFAATIRNFQSRVKCCSIMEQEGEGSYEYLPEQPVTKAEYEDTVRRITEAVAEDVDKTHVDCASGACPIDFKK